MRPSEFIKKLREDRPELFCIGKDQRVMKCAACALAGRDGSRLRYVGSGLRTEYLDCRDCYADCFGEGLHQIIGRWNFQQCMILKICVDAVEFPVSLADY